jgi:two-component system, chemotaxis family, protein-glutamate methylesterase/glutaminase
MTTRVLIVDDSALMREVLTQIFKQAGGIDVVGAASNPIVAMEMIRSLKPDVLTLDVEMPRMDGLTFLEQLLNERPMPVIMVSTLTERGSSTALRALELGALDVVGKPKLDVRAGTFAVAEELVAKVKGAAQARPRTPRAAAPPPQPALRALRPSAGRVIAIGSSTGGTEALVRMFQALPADGPAIVIVQHIPAAFTPPFAERLGRTSRVQVKLGSDGEALRPGCALLAPGGSHMRVVRAGTGLSVRLSAEPAQALHRPSVDVLFESCAQSVGSKAIGVLLTGMGQDGAAGLLSMRKAGSRTIAQDEATCVVFGMPKAAIALGAAERVLGLDAIAPALAAL